MGQKVTIVIDDDLLKKLREHQAKTIMKNAKSGYNHPSQSFSRTVNEILMIVLTKRGSSHG
jgi:uncharacterized membrane protein